MVDQRQRHSPWLKVSKKKKEKKKFLSRWKPKISDHCGQTVAINTAFISSATYIYAVYKEISKFLKPRLKCVVFPDFLQHFELVHTHTLFKHLARWSDEFAQKLGRAAVVVVCRVHDVLVNTGEMSEKRKKQNHTRYSRR